MFTHSHIFTTADGAPFTSPGATDSDFRDFDPELNPLIPPNPFHPIPAPCLAAVDQALAGLRTGIAHAADIPSPYA